MSGGAVGAFLQYSLKHGRRIRAVLMAEGGMRVENLTVTSLSAETFTYVTARAKRPAEAAISAVLSCDYARGDKGED